jgi:hypothetical protein
MFWKGYFLGILTVFAVCTAIVTLMVIKTDRKENKK